MIDDILTKREKEIVRLVSKGFSNNQIIDALSITLGTISKHMDHIYSKLLISDGTRDSHSAKRVRLVTAYLKEHKELLDEL